MARMTASTWRWCSRAAWIVAGVGAVVATGEATDGRSSGIGIAAAVVLWSVVGVVVAALVVPSAASLTALRMLAPLVVAGTVAATIGGAGAIGLLCVLAAALTALLTGSGEVGEAYVQASAYGDEHRFPLRPPVAWLAPVVVSWCLWAAAIIVGPLLLGAASWLVGAVVTAAALALTWLVVPRYHRLARRWVVLVPAGLVVHDHVVLAETTLVQRANVASMHLALADTGAADFTGPCGGHAVEVEVRDMLTVVRAPARRGERGTALHVGAFLVAPTRPGRTLAAAAAHRLPVG